MIKQLMHKIKKDKEAQFGIVFVLILTTRCIIKLMYGV